MHCSRKPFEDEMISGGTARVFDDLAVVVKIINEEIERLNALFEAALDAFPFRRADDARDEVEGQRFFDPGAFAIDDRSECWPGSRRAVGGELAVHEFAIGERLHVTRKRAGGGAWLAALAEHLVKEVAKLVIVKFH